VACLAVEADPVVGDFETEASFWGRDEHYHVCGLGVTQHVREGLLDDQIDVAADERPDERPEGAIFVPQHGHSRSDGTDWIEACIATTKALPGCDAEPLESVCRSRPRPWARAQHICALSWSARRLKLAV
jgi:hypothetical protein